jgi:broad specificity phosphatase PhoE
MSYNLFFARHGETELNLAGKIQGNIDSALTEKGVQDAKKLGQKITGLNFDKVYSSDLGRSFMTAYFALQTANISQQIQPDKRLREINFGDLVLLLNNSMHDGTYPHFTDKPDFVYPGGESFEILCNRVGDFLRENEGKWQGQQILLVVHSGVVRALQKVLEIPVEVSSKNRIINGFLAEVEVKDGKSVNYKIL